jgi:hypothetical protein
VRFGKTLFTFFFFFFFFFAASGPADGDTNNSDNTQGGRLEIHIKNCVFSKIKRFWGWVGGAQARFAGKGGHGIRRNAKTFFVFFGLGFFFWKDGANIKNNNNK